MVSFWLFVRPALRRLLGIEDSWWGSAVAGKLAAPQCRRSNVSDYLVLSYSPYPATEPNTTAKKVLCGVEPSLCSNDASD